MALDLLGNIQTGVVILARRSCRREDLLPVYREMEEGLIVDFVNDDVCGVIVKPGSDWICSWRGEAKFIHDQKRRVRVISYSTHAFVPDYVN